MDMNQINETVAELARLQKEYEAALDRGDQRQADLIQRRIDCIDKHL